MHNEVWFSQILSLLSIKQKTRLKHSKGAFILAQGKISTRVIGLEHV